MPWLVTEEQPSSLNGLAIFPYIARINTTDAKRDALNKQRANINLAKATSEEVQAIKEDWLKHKVLVFRDQNITREQHIAFGKNFGKLEIHPFAPHPKEYPEIVKIISNDKVQYAASNWHSDVTLSLIHI